MSVIYQIKNTINNKSYIGSTSDFDARKLRHVSTLKNNNHHNIYLQRAYNKYGNVFIFEILENCSKEEQFNRELHWINLIKPEYNIGSVGGGDNLTNNPRREEIIEQIKYTIHKNLSNMTPEERSKKWGKSGSSNPNWKGGISIFTCPSCGKENKNQGQKTCNKCRDRTGTNNSFYGKNHSEETKRILSEKAKERYAKGMLPANSKAVSCEGIIYPSVTEASRHYGINVSAMSYRVRSKSTKWKDFFFLNA